MNRTHIAMIWILWCVVGSLLTAASAKKNVVPLPQIIKPVAFLTDGTQFYIVEQAAVNIFRWDGFGFLKKFGERGEGPQEYNVSRSDSIYLTVHPDKLMVYTSTKCLEYDINGNYIKEYRLRDIKMGVYNQQMTVYVGGIYKLGNYYLYDDLAPGDKLMQYASYYLADLKLNKIKELARHRLYIDIFGKKLYVFEPYYYPIFYKEMVFLARGDNLEIIGINKAGETFLNLKYNYKKVKVTDDHIASYHHYYKTEDPDCAHYEREKSRFRFPEYFPVIKHFEVANDQIYVQTWKQNGQKESEFLIFNLKGQYLRTVYLPVEPDNIEKDYPYLIHNGQLVQLIENMDDEIWELHITPIE